MNDPDFRGKLKDQRVAREELRKAREIVVAQMKAKIDAVTQKLGTNDTAAIRAALRADPEWQSLYKRCQDANTALAESRRKTQSFVSQRLNPSAELPAEKPVAGKGPAKSISK